VREWLFDAWFFRETDKSKESGRSKGGYRKNTDKKRVKQNLLVMVCSRAAGEKKCVGFVITLRLSKIYIFGNE